MYKINISKSVKTDKKGYEFISSIYHSIKDKVDKEINIDFSQCQLFDANLASALGAVLDKLVDDGFSIWLASPTSKGVRRSLSRNQFFQAWKVETNIEDKENFINYRKFRRDNSEDFKRYIDKELLQKQKFPKCTKLVGERITENIYEIYTNAITHGKTDYVYSCGEYDISKHTLDMTIVDCGLTIPSNVNSFMVKQGLTELDACKAIEWAFEDGHTTKSTPGGLGLAILKQFIEFNGGCLQMVSGEAFLEYSNSGMKSVFLDIPFPGTIVNMKFNFDDEKRYLLESEKQKIDLKDLL